jgi:hypothetical protein
METVKRKVCSLLGLIALLALGGCDTCGNLAKFNLPSVPNSCQGNPPAK